MNDRLFPVAQETYTSDDYWTPRWIFDKLGLVFDVDVACPPEGPPNTPCRTWFTQEDDGLVQEWRGRVWMNPPFSRPSPWVDKFMKHGNGIALVPFAKSKWCQTLFEKADAVLFLPANLKFDQGSIPMPVGLWAIGQQNVDALRDSGIGPVR